MASVSAELEFPPKIVISSYGLATRTSPGSIVLAVPLASRWALFSHALVWLSGHHTVEHFRTMCPNLRQLLELALGIGIFHPGQHPVDIAVEQIVDELDDVVDALVNHDRTDHRF